MLTANMIAALADNHRTIYDALPNDRYIATHELEQQMKKAGTLFNGRSVINILHYLSKHEFIDGHQKRGVSTTWYWRRNDPKIKKRPALVGVVPANSNEAFMPQPNSDKPKDEIDDMIEMVMSVASYLEGIKDGTRMQTDKRIAELEKENATLREKLGALEAVRQAMKILSTGE